MSEQVEEVVLHEATEERYLNYALSVITSRALPDVRDGLKPVQRRILYAMYHNLGLTPDGKHRKSAAVVGEVMSKYHPHGDQSIYDAMVRLAQPFTVRYPLVDGQGNFGSLDGDNAAAMRYTEAKLRHIAVELLEEIRKETVDHRANYDGTLEEPIVLPARLPNVLINGATGIAVGMATNIPPHNLREVVGALMALIDDRELSIERIVSRWIQAPDFPTGGQILNTREDLIRIYETGQGSVEIRGEYTTETTGKVASVVITSIPWGLNKATLIEEIADHIRAGRVPQLVDIRDESTDIVRIVMELRKGADADAAMAFLYRKTALQSRFAVNMTVLVPGENPEVGRPERLDLRSVLLHFLDFRERVTRRRLEWDLRQLERRIHILRGFEIVFDALDEAIRLIRTSDDKGDARDRLMQRFGLDWEQSEAILETKLYRLAKLQIDAIRKELEEKEAAAAELRTILGDTSRMWALVKSELAELRQAYGDRRLTKVTGPVEAVTFSEENYIVAEDAFVIVTRDGWVKRQKSYTELGAIRVREGDAIRWVLPSSSRESLVLFTDRGRAYTVRAADLTLTTGYGDPIQSRFEFADGERIVGAAVTDARTLPVVPEAVRSSLGPDDPSPPWVLAMTRAGKTMRMSLSSFVEPSTRNGRAYMRLDPEVPDDRVTDAVICDGSEVVSLASYRGRCVLFQVAEANVLSGAGRGVAAIRLSADDHVLGFRLVRSERDGLEVETNRGRQEVVSPRKFSVTGRGGRGREIIRVGYLKQIVRAPVELVFRREEEPGGGRTE